MASPEFTGAFLLKKFDMVGLFLELYHVYVFEGHEVVGLLLAAQVLFLNATRQSALGPLQQSEDPSSCQLFQ
jgi:hypothetical protein